MKKPRYLWPAVWGLIGFGAMVWSVFVHDQHRSDFLFLAGFLAMIKADVIALQAEVECWRKL